MVPSNNLTAAPVFVTTAADAQQAAIAYSGTVSGNRIVSESPARLMFTATGSDNKIHMYGLDLTNLASTTPVQIGSLTLDNANQLCDDASFTPTNLYQPSTLFTLIHVNMSSTSSTNSCGTGGDVYEVINYTDPTSTAPAVVSVTSTDFDPMYHASGLLAGMILYQGTNLDFFTSSAFTSPTHILQNVTEADDLADPTTGGEDMIGDSVAFYGITNSSNTQLYRINISGVATSVYTAVGGLDAAANGDASSIFFSDADSSLFRILRAPIAGGSAVALYNADLTQGNYSLIGSNGTLLAYSRNVTAGDGSVYTISATSATTTPTLVTTLTGTVIDAFFAEATPGTLSSAQILINGTVPTSGVRSSEAVTFGGTETQPQLANSVFEPVGVILSGKVLQIRGITDTGVAAQEGGGTFNVYTISNASVVPLTLSGGGAYAIPASTVAFAAYIASGSTDATGVGIAGQATGLATDNASHLIVPITFTNTDINPF